MEIQHFSHKKSQLNIQTYQQNYTMDNLEEMTLKLRDISTCFMKLWRSGDHLQAPVHYPFFIPTECSRHLPWDVMRKECYWKANNLSRLTNQMNFTEQMTDLKKNILKKNVFRQTQQQTGCF